MGLAKSEIFSQGQDNPAKDDVTVVSLVSSMLGLQESPAEEQPVSAFTSPGEAGFKQAAPNPELNAKDVHKFLLNHLDQNGRNLGVLHTNFEKILLSEPDLAGAVKQNNTATANSQGSNGIPGRKEILMLTNASEQEATGENRLLNARQLLPAGITGVGQSPAKQITGISFNQDREHKPPPTGTEIQVAKTNGGQVFNQASNMPGHGQAVLPAQGSKAQPLGNHQQPAWQQITNLSNQGPDNKLAAITNSPTTKRSLANKSVQQNLTQSQQIQHLQHSEKQKSTINPAIQNGESKLAPANSQVQAQSRNGVKFTKQATENLSIQEQAGKHAQNPAQNYNLKNTQQTPKPVDASILNQNQPHKPVPNSPELPGINSKIKKGSEQVTNNPAIERDQAGKPAQQNLTQSRQIQHLQQPEKQPTTKPAIQNGESKLAPANSQVQAQSRNGVKFTKQATENLSIQEQAGKHAQNPAQNYNLKNTQQTPKPADASMLNQNQPHKPVPNNPELPGINSKIKKGPEQVTNSPTTKPALQNQESKQVSNNSMVQVENPRGEKTSRQAPSNPVKQGKISKLYQNPAFLSNKSNNSMRVSSFIVLQNQNQIENSGYRQPANSLISQLSLNKLSAPDIDKNIYNTSTPVELTVDRQDALSYRESNMQQIKAAMLPGQNQGDLNRSLPQPVQVAARMASVIQQAVTDSRGTTTLRIKLKPEHLGEITVRLVYNQGNLQAHFIAASAHTRELLEQSMGQLRENLAQLNINLNDTSTSPGHDGNDGWTGQYQQSQYSQGQFRQGQFNTPDRQTPFKAPGQPAGEDMPAESPITTETANINHLV